MLGASTLALNIGAELKKFFIDHLIAAINVVEAIDFGHTVCSQGCENKPKITPSVSEGAGCLLLYVI